MVKEFIATGETVEVAFANACNEIGVEPTKAKMEVLEEAVKKTFGLFGGNPAKVRAYYEPTATENAVDYLKQMFKIMNVGEIEYQVVEEEKGVQITLIGDDISFIIGHRGETLDSLQYLVSLVANQDKDEYFRISLDVGNFRVKRQETLENLGKKMAAKALKYGRNQKLEPMNPYERRIIHFAVQSIEGIKSWSEGEDLVRHVIIGPVGGEKQRYNNRPNNNFNKNRGDKKPYAPRDNKFAKPKKEEKPVISEKAVQPFSPAPLDTTTERKKVEDAPLYGRITR